LPSLAEQAAIVRFLDHANQRIRRYILAKQKLIKLLEEQRQAVIYRAVTRGLDPNVRLKPSGVKWLGDVPEPWEIVEVRRLASFVTSGSRGWANYYSDEGDCFLQSGNLGRSMALDLSHMQFVRPPRGAEGERTRVQLDDVLICVTGALTGNVVIVDSDLGRPAYVNQHVALVRVTPGALQPRFLAYALHSVLGKVQFKNREYGGTKQGLGLDDIKAAVVLVPPLEEQKRICLALDEHQRASRSMAAAVRQDMHLMREYRTRLIADIVTGKLDVREAAARLPEAPDDTEPLDDVEAETDNEEAADDSDAVAGEAEA
jgi:type I restriction enzyme S subunit